jgi:glycosyltransferase involved in cell wall biosynthesis
LSAFFLKAHSHLERRANKKNSPPPRQLKFAPGKSEASVVHINGNFVIGGTSQLIADIIETTSDQYRHKVIVPKLPDPLPYQPLPICQYDLGNMSGLSDFLENENPSLVHIHYWVRPMHRHFDFGIWYQQVFRICEELGLKVIQNIDVPTKPFHAENIRHNVFVSEYVRKAFNDSELPSSVIYPGSDFSHFTGDPNRELTGNTVGMVYRLDTDKLDASAIEVFISAVKKMPSLKCYIIGGGYYYDHYRQRVNEERLSANFIFTGFVSYDKLPSWYSKLGLIVAPVHDESFGQVTPFAMGMGLPVVGYDTGAMAELLGSNDDLVPTGNVERLAQLVVDRMQDPALRKQKGIANQSRARQMFSVESMIEKYKSLYQSIL